MAVDVELPAAEAAPPVPLWPQGRGDMGGEGGRSAMPCLERSATEVEAKCEERPRFTSAQNRGNRVQWMRREGRSRHGGAGRGGTR